MRADSSGHQPRQEGSGLIDIRAMAAVLGSGVPAPTSVDQVAVSFQPVLGASLPTAGAIMPVAESPRPWWLMPSLAVGGMLLITVVALLAVLLLQPTRASGTRGSDPIPGEAAANGTAPANTTALADTTAPANTMAPADVTAPANTVAPANITALAETMAPASPVAQARPAAVNAPRVVQPRPEPASPAAAKRDGRRQPMARPPRRRSRRDRKIVAKRTPKKVRPVEPRDRPRSIVEILMGVGKVRHDSPKGPRKNKSSIQGAEAPGARGAPRRILIDMQREATKRAGMHRRPGRSSHCCASPKVPLRASLPARLGYRDIRGGMSRVMAAARSCGKRFSTSGRVTVRLVIAGATGRVRGVTPKGAHATSPTGRCVARSLRSARFKPFARATQSFYYTVILR